MFLHDREELECHSAWPLRSGLPLLNRRFAGIEVTGENRLADAKTLAQLFDLLGIERRRSRKTGRVEAAHRRFVDSTHLEHRRGRGVDRLKCVVLEFTFGCHRKSPSSRSLESVG